MTNCNLCFEYLGVTQEESIVHDKTNTHLKAVSMMVDLQFVKIKWNIDQAADHTVKNRIQYVRFARERLERVEKTMNQLDRLRSWTI